MKTLPSVEAVSRFNRATCGENVITSIKEGKNRRSSVVDTTAEQCSRPMHDLVKILSILSLDTNLRVEHRSYTNWSLFSIHVTIQLRVLIPLICYHLHPAGDLKADTLKEMTTWSVNRKNSKNK